MKGVAARNLPRLLGLSILVVAIWFLARTVISNWDALSGWRPTPRDLAVMGGLSAVYCGALFFLAEAWHRIVNLFGFEPRVRTYQSYTATLIIRYIPGNVAHLIGRAAYLRNGPLSKGALGRATLLELAITPMGAVLVLAFLWPYLPTEGLPHALTLVPKWLPLAFLVAGLGLLPVLGRSSRIGGLVPPILFTAAFMAGLGGIFAVLTWNATSVPLPVAAAIALFAWIAGFATPGAPGGLGTREAILVALLSNVGCPGEVALILSIQLRLVTLTGEVLCAIVGWRVLPMSMPAPKAPAGAEQE